MADPRERDEDEDEKLAQELATLAAQMAPFFVEAPHRRPLARQHAAELTIEPLIDAIAEFGTAVGDSVGKDYRINNPRVVKHLRQYLSERVPMINQTTRDALLAALKNEEPRAAIRKVFEQAREHRATLIAQSEISRSSSFAAIDAGKWVGALDFKQWISQRDEKVRHTHAAMDGQIVGWLEDFVSPSGAKGPYPGALGTPEEDIACRCWPAPTNKTAKRNLADGRALQETADALRAPMIEEMTAAWRKVFDEQEAALLAELDEEG